MYFPEKTTMYWFRVTSKGCLTSLSTKFHLCNMGKFCWWKKQRVFRNNYRPALRAVMVVIVW